MIYHVRYPDSGAPGKFLLPGIILLVNSGTLRLGSGIPLNLRTQVQTKAGIRYLESGIHGLESRVQDCIRVSCKGRIAWHIQSTVKEMFIKK